MIHNITSALIMCISQLKIIHTCKCWLFAFLCKVRENKWKFMQLHFTKKLAKHLNQNYCKDTEPFYVKRSFFSDNIAYIINPILNPQLERYQQRTTTLCVPGPPPPDLAHAQCKIYTIFYMEQHQRCVCIVSFLRKCPTALTANYIRTQTYKITTLE